MKEQDKIKTKQDVLEFIDAYIYYRGGMFTRIDALDIKEFLKGKRKREYKQIKKVWERDVERKQEGGE